ncbi:MAG: DUF4760 domain-containing protein [Rhizobiaceae bacterium]|nr:DUF4760 domain-containing protein [Rhizobiaceae bacterium]
MASTEAADIRFILNMYEVIAIGIKKNAYATAVKDWIACKGFSARYQSDHNPRIYLVFEALAKSGRTRTKKSTPKFQTDPLPTASLVCPSMLTRR